MTRFAHQDANVDKERHRERLKGVLRTLTVTSCPLIVTVALSGTVMVCFPIRDILAVTWTLERLAAAVRGLARLNLTLVANMSCVNVQCGVFRRTLQQVIAAGIDLYLIAMTNVLRWTAR
jgi:hypothetical protein